MVTLTLAKETVDILDAECGKGERGRTIDRLVREWRASMVAAGLAVHHIDGDPRNNDPANLSVVSVRESAKQAARPRKKRT